MAAAAEEASAWAHLATDLGMGVGAGVSSRHAAGWIHAVACPVNTFIRPSLILQGTDCSANIIDLSIWLHVPATCLGMMRTKRPSDGTANARAVLGTIGRKTCRQTQ